MNNLEENNTVICPNCECTNMIETKNPIVVMDGLEWLAFLSTTLVAGMVFSKIYNLIIDKLFFLNIPPQAYGVAILILSTLAALLSYKLTVCLSENRARRDGICIWHVRCCKCNSPYRIVRPYGTVPSWKDREENAEGVTTPPLC